MSDKEKNTDKDIVTSAEDTPEIIGDEKLEDAAGGWSWGASMSTNVVMSGGSTMLNVGVNADTVYGGGEKDDLIQSLDASMLRTRPGRMKNPYGG
ncbi:MAG: hypothetical protein AAF293_06220 [Pseudomonadota bacterium]